MNEHVQTASSQALFNPLAPEFIRNPYPYYERMRASDPVHLTEHGMYVASRHADITVVLRDKPGAFAMVQNVGGNNWHGYCFRKEDTEIADFMNGRITTMKGNGELAALQTRNAAAQNQIAEHAARVEVAVPTDQVDKVVEAIMASAKTSTTSSSSMSAAC